MRLSHVHDWTELTDTCFPGSVIGCISDLTLFIPSLRYPGFFELCDTLGSDHASHHFGNTTRVHINSYIHSYLFIHSSKNGRRFSFWFFSIRSDGRSQMEHKMVQAIPLSIYAEYFNPFTLIIRSLPAICYKSLLHDKKTGMERENSIFCQHEPDK